MAKRKIQFGHADRQDGEPQPISNDSVGLGPVSRLCDSSDLISIGSKSNAVDGEEKTLFRNAPVETVGACIAMETADAAKPLSTVIPGQRIEQMYHLADIFASIFEALPNPVQTSGCHQRRRRPNITT
jgi:hypothetical protein